MSTIVLIGLRGSGKSTLGRWLAEELQMEFIDTDSEVLAFLKYASVTEAWGDIGEEGWRRAEEDVIPTLLQREGVVVALGGGAPMLPLVQAALKSVQVVLNLCAPAEILATRIGVDSDRPSLSASEAEISALRLPIFWTLGTHTIDTSGDLHSCHSAILQTLP